MKRIAIVLLLAAGLAMLHRVMPTALRTAVACADDSGDSGDSDDEGDEGGSGT